jgi:hypothetical protein
MRFAVGMLGLAALGVVVASVLSAAPPPLKVDKGAPRLDEPKSTEPAEKPAADNSACHVCHGNYQEEWLAVTHAKANVGCMKCHGASIAHRNDEDNITPPDIIYPSDGIEKACIKCHSSHDVAAKKVVARWKERCSAIQDPGKLVCTDCHGEHRLKQRVVRWDKHTRKLLSEPKKTPKGKK